MADGEPGGVLFAKKAARKEAFACTVRRGLIRDIPAQGSWPSPGRWAAVAESPSTGDLNAGKTVTITLTTSEAVTVTGTPTVTVTGTPTPSQPYGFGSKLLLEASGQ